MWLDPSVAEIHQTRGKLSQAYGDDLHAIFAAARRGELSKPLDAPAGNVAQPAALTGRPASASRRQDGV